MSLIPKGKACAIPVTRRATTDSGSNALVAPWDLSLLRGLLSLTLASAWAGLLWQFARRPRTNTSRLAQVTSLALISALALNGCIFSGGGTTAGSSDVMDFSYDRLGQLIGVKVNQTATEGYTFDPSGNLTSLTVGNTTTTFAANNLNQQTAPGTHVYDAKGQKTTLDGKTFEWDDEGRLTAIVMGTNRTELAYDGMSRRTKITEFTNGAVTSKKLYWWLGGSIVSERDGLAAGFPITKRYFGQGVLQGVTKLFYTFDHLGSVRELVDNAGVVQADYRYSTYGERTKQAGALESDWGYAGLWHHGPSGLDLATYRAYDAANRRWISRDPLGEGVDYNLYRYCGNNPISRVDPRGLSWSINGAQYTSQIAFWAGVYNSADGSIETLDFGGHGSSGYQGIDPYNNDASIGGLRVQNGQVELVGPWTKDPQGNEVKHIIPGLLEMLKKKLKKKAKIRFWGCHVGAQGGLAQKFSSLYPDATVTASPDFTYSNYGSDESKPLSSRTSPNDYTNAWFTTPWDFQQNWATYQGGQPVP